jgi:hypothetical protein
VDPVPDRILLRKSGGAGYRTQDLGVLSQELFPLESLLIEILHLNSHVSLRQVDIHFDADTGSTVSRIKYQRSFSIPRKDFPIDTAGS